MSLRIVFVNRCVSIDDCRWVPIKDNDWYHIRDTIKVGMKVQVEVLVIAFN